MQLVNKWHNRDRAPCCMLQCGAEIERYKKSATMDEAYQFSSDINLDSIVDSILTDLSEDDRSYKIQEVQAQVKNADSKFSFSSHSNYLTLLSRFIPSAQPSCLAGQNTKLMSGFNTWTMHTQIIKKLWEEVFVLNLISTINIIEMIMFGTTIYLLQSPSNPNNHWQFPWIHRIQFHVSRVKMN